MGLKVLPRNTTNYYIAGPRNTNIFGGNVRDIIYAHQDSAYQQNQSILDFSSTIKKQGTTPCISVIVNGQKLIDTVQITAQYGIASQTFSFDASKIGIINSLKLLISN